MDIMVLFVIAQIVHVLTQNKILIMKVFEYIFRIFILCLYLLFIPALFVVMIMGLFFNLSVLVFTGTDELSKEIGEFYECCFSIFRQCRVILNL